MHQATDQQNLHKPFGPFLFACPSKPCPPFRPWYWSRNLRPNVPHVDGGRKTTDFRSGRRVCPLGGYPVPLCCREPRGKSKGAIRGTSHPEVKIGPHPVMVPFRKHRQWNIPEPQKTHTHTWAILKSPARAFLITSVVMSYLAKLFRALG